MTAMPFLLLRLKKKITRANFVFIVIIAQYHTAENVCLILISQILAEIIAELMNLPVAVDQETVQQTSFIKDMKLRQDIGTFFVLSNQNKNKNEKSF